MARGTKLTAEGVPDSTAVSVEFGRIVVGKNPCIIRTQLDPIMIVPNREPFDIGMWRQIGMRIEGNKTDLPHLRDFHILGKTIEKLF